MADPERLELPTSAFEAHCSIQLSYGSALAKYTFLSCQVAQTLALVSRKTAPFVPCFSTSSPCQGCKFL